MDYEELIKQIKQKFADETGFKEFDYRNYSFINYVIDDLMTMCLEYNNGKGN